MSANSVLPPFGFTTRADSSENFAGIGRNELSECHRQLPRLNRWARLIARQRLAVLAEIGDVVEPGGEPVIFLLGRRCRRARFSRSPKFSANAICCSSVMSWSWNSSTAYLSMPASISARLLRRQRLAQIDAGDLADKMRMKLPDRDRHGVSPDRRAVGPALFGEKLLPDIGDVNACGAHARVFTRCAPSGRRPPG